MMMWRSSERSVSGVMCQYDGGIVGWYLGDDCLGGKIKHVLVSGVHSPDVYRITVYCDNDRRIECDYIRVLWSVRDGDKEEENS